MAFPVANANDVNFSVSVKDYGAQCDGVTDDTAAVQAAVNAAPVGGEVTFPPGNTLVTSPVTVNKGITIRGRAAFTSRILASGCDGVDTVGGVGEFHLENIEIAQKVRYSTTPNNYVGVNIDGTTGSRPANNLLKDVYVDGFQTAVRTRYMWSSELINVKSNYGLIGLDVYGLSVNNVVSANCQFQVVGGVGSIGIRFAGQESSSDATVVASQGWTLSDSLTFGAETGIAIIGNTNITIHDCIIDYNTKYGIQIIGNGTAFAGNCDIHDNYIAMNGASGTAAIQSANTVANSQNLRNQIHHNEIVAYSGATCSYGVNQSGSQGLCMISTNTIQNFATADIFTQSSGNSIIDNACLSALANNISFLDGNLNEISGNVGHVYLPGGGNPSGYITQVNRKVAFGNAIPTVGAWVVGDRLINSTPAVGSPKSWVCTVAGSPGTWTSEGNL